MFKPQPPDSSSTIMSTSASDSILSPEPSMSSPSTTMSHSMSNSPTSKQYENHHHQHHHHDSHDSRDSSGLHNDHDNHRHNRRHNHRAIVPQRLVNKKNGNCNLFLENISRRKYVRDLFTTMIDIKWRYNLMFAAFGFVFSWIVFACIWYLILYFHDDFKHENDPNWSPCIVNVNSFPAALLFSIETQSTLGFGSRIISVECPAAIVIFCIQLIFGVVVECLIVGMVFAKLSRPAKRSQTIMFSKFATICLREGKMCLTFRVGDVRSKSHIIGATIKASLVCEKLTKEGELIPFYHHELGLKIDDSTSTNLLLIWPITIVHVIDETSLLYQLNQEQFENSNFEIITILEGTVESTGQSIQVRSSYLPEEVKWGHRFDSIISKHGFGRYTQTIIDYKKFNRIIPVDTPSCSPEKFYKSTFHPDQDHQQALIFSSRSTSSSPPSFESLNTRHHQSNLQTKNHQQHQLTNDNNESHFPINPRHHHNHQLDVNKMLVSSHPSMTQLKELDEDEEHHNRLLDQSHIDSKGEPIMFVTIT